MQLEKREARKFGTAFVSACEQIFRDPLFNHLNGDRNLEVLLWSDDSDALWDWLTVIASCGCMYEIKLDIQCCGTGIAEFERSLKEKCRMFDEIFVRGDTANISFVVEPAFFPAYIACAPEYAHRLPAGLFHVPIENISPSEELLRLAENLHYAFSISYGSRDSLDEILAKMHEDPYNYHSSLLQAAHLPVKLYCAGIKATKYEDAACEYTALVEANRGIVNRLVYLEHTRWTVFMALSGWSMPTHEQMMNYAFAFNPDDNSMIDKFRHNGALLHPSLAACSPDGVDILETDEGAGYWNGSADPSKLDDLSRVSIWQHRYVSRLSEQHREIVRRELAEYKSGINYRILELDRLESAIKRIERQESGAVVELKRALESVRTKIDASLYEKIVLLLKSSVEASRRRSYLQGDIFSTKTIGFVLLFRRNFTRIVRTLCDSAGANINTLMILDPERAAFITGYDPRQSVLEAELRGGVETFIRKRRLRTKIRFFDASDGMEKALMEASEWAGDTAVFDVTGSPPDFVLAALSHECFIARDGKLMPFRGCSAVGVMNSLPRDIQVSDIFAAMNRETFEGWDIPDTVGIEKLISPAFSAYLELTKDEEPGKASIFSGKNGLCQTISGQTITYQVNDPQDIHDFFFDLPVDLAIKRNVTGCLKRLAEDGFIGGLNIIKVKETGRYQYSLTSPVWSDCSGRYPPLLDILSADESRDDYICSVKYELDKKKKRYLLKMRVVHDEFPTPDGMTDALEKFREAGCFEQTNNGDWRFSSAASKGIFSKEGNLLEDFVWVNVAKNPNFKDVQLSYSFGLVSRPDELEQEIDVVAITQKNQLVMFSCKLGAEALKKEAAKEIHQHCRFYSMQNPVPVLVTSCPEKIMEEKGFVEGGEALEYVRSLGVHFIDRSILADESRFQQVLNDIAGAQKGMKV